MAEDYSPYHVPQQSRRDKLRITAANFQGCSGLLPAYDPSLISSDLLTCANVDGSSSSTQQYYSLDQPTSSFGSVLNSNCNNGNSNCNPFMYPLSLSLSSNHNHRVGAMCEVGGSGLVPVGPFTGYASVLKGSRFLRPAQELLEEICDVGHGERFSDCSLLDSLMEGFDGNGVGNDFVLSCVDGGEHGRIRSRLISMLDEVYKRYKQYYQQMQAVIQSFEYVAGLGNAAPYTNLALKTMYKHFRCLKNVITDQIHFHVSHGKDDDQRFGKNDSDIYGQRPVNNSGTINHQPVWRPQRGLPERAVTVLRAWLFDHFLHPYPTDTDKIMLAKQTGLSRSQVSNWFINARVRLWKPMVEEIHMLETRQTQKASHRDEQDFSRPSDCVHLTNTIGSEIPSTSTQRLQDTPSTRSLKPQEAHQPLNISYNHLSSNSQVGVGMNSNVSLTLGLYQNNGIGLSEFPIEAAQQSYGIGLETSNEGYAMGRFGVQNRHFGRDHIGGHLLHDFVG